MKKKNRIKIENCIHNLECKDSLLTNSELNFAYRQVYHSKSYMRKSAVEALAHTPFTQKLEECLISLSYDKDELVRICATEQLSRGRSETILKRLKELREDYSHLVRGYAVDPFFEVWINKYGFHVKSVQEYLNNSNMCEDEEKNDWVKIVYAQNRYLSKDNTGLSDIVHMLMKRKDNSERIVDMGINAIDLLRNIRTEKEVDKYLVLLLEKDNFLDFQREEIQKILSCKEVPRVLLLDEKNIGISQIIEYIGNQHSECVFYSAGTNPGECICCEVVSNVKEMDGYDIMAYQYPKKIQQQWFYDFIVPIEIRI